MKRAFLSLAAIAAVIFLCPVYGYAAQIVISVNGGMTLGGNSYQQGNLIRINDHTNPAGTNSLYNAMFANNRNLDVAHIQSDGKILASHDGSKFLWNGVDFYAGDVIRYNPVGGATELFLKGNTGTTTPAADIWGHTTSIFRNSTDTGAVNVDITSIDLLPNGRILLSSGDATSYLQKLGGGLLAFQDEDIVEYDPVAKKAVGVYFDATPYYTTQTNGFARLSSNEVLVSVLTTTTIGGTSYTPQQIVKINTSTSTASLFMSLPVGISQKIDAIYVVPEPATLLLLGLGALGLLRKRRP